MAKVSGWPLALFLLACCGQGCSGQTDLTLATSDSSTPEVHAPSMDLARLGELINRIDPEADQPQPGIWNFSFQDRQLAVFTDVQADRMRIVVPITRADQLDPALMKAMLQANYDSALDARYAIAQGLVWSVFVHPLAHLTTHEFFSAVGQVINTTETFGESFSSGMFLFGGGDNAQRQRELLEKLRELERRDQPST